MLLEFRVRNFRSIRDEQVLSLVASGDKALADTHVAPTGLKALPGAVRSAVVYGPNASGKSTLLFALSYMRAVVAESATLIKPGQTYNVQRFKLDPAFATLPTEFEITFLLGGVRHQYSFAMTPERIVSESLLVYRTAKAQQWFDRRIRDEVGSRTIESKSGHAGQRLHDESDVYEYTFSSHLTGARKLWQDSTRPNALFLSTAAQLNSEPLGPVFRWLLDAIAYIPAGGGVHEDYTTSKLTTAEGREEVREFLRAADVCIADVLAVPRKGVRQQVVLHATGIAQINRQEGDMLVPQFLHQTAKGSAMFEFEEESEGTQRLYGLIAPVLDVLQSGRVLVVDELESSLHTLLVRRLIKMFHDPSANRSNAQLIFTTHDTSLLDHTLFRRDQIWFTEKDADQATTLYPLSDFSPRKEEAWGRGYIAGRYGAVPFFSELPGILSQQPLEPGALETKEADSTSA